MIEEVIREGVHQNPNRIRCRSVCIIPLTNKSKTDNTYEGAKDVQGFGLVWACVIPCPLALVVGMGREGVNDILFVFLRWPLLGSRRQQGQL